MCRSSLLSKFNQMEDTLHSFFKNIDYLTQSKVDDGFCKIERLFELDTNRCCALDCYKYSINIISPYDLNNIVDTIFNVLVGMGTFPNDMELSLTIPYSEVETKLKFIMNVLEQYKEEFLKK